MLYKNANCLFVGGMVLALIATNSNGIKKCADGERHNLFVSSLLNTKLFPSVKHTVVDTTKWPWPDSLML